MGAVDASFFFAAGCLYYFISRLQTVLSEVIALKNDEICPVCAASMYGMKGGGVYAVCKACGYMYSGEPPGAGAEVVSLEAVREKNFRFVCRMIRESFPGAGAILDVGCSSGLFLKVAAAEGLSAAGLEPDARLADAAAARGCGEVINGFFPAAEGLAGRKYDVITFNDSLEHIPALQEVLRGIKAHLKTPGLVVVSVPDSDGLIFTVSRLLYRLGISAPFDRMWQRGFASPHVHYFNKKNLRALFENNGFVTRRAASLPFYAVRGLWKRISCKSSFVVSVFAWLGMVALYPLFMLRKDALTVCFSVAGARCRQFV
jgi:2-polyprenyl-3-methyl-5-hydroxy-6-metoxy-1,4-benzoquinol methylase